MGEEGGSGVKDCSSLLQLKDLRSQVTREACVTLSYLAVVFRGDFSAVAEKMMAELIPLLPNSAKVPSHVYSLSTHSQHPHS